MPRPGRRPVSTACLVALLLAASAASADEPERTVRRGDRVRVGEIGGTVLHVTSKAMEFVPEQASGRDGTLVTVRSEDFDRVRVRVVRRRTGRGIVIGSGLGLVAGVGALVYAAQHSSEGVAPDQAPFVAGAVGGLGAVVGGVIGGAIGHAHRYERWERASLPPARTSLSLGILPGKDRVAALITVRF
jgi:hypothetical protein